MRVVTAPDYIPAIYAPDTFDLDAYLARLNSALMDYGHYRRTACKTDPLLFALLYFSDHLRSEETGPDINLSQFHIDIARAAERWLRNDLGLGELREAWIAPRGAAKTTWTFVILASWALAFGHRRFVAAFAENSAMARRHLLSLKQEFATNELLRADFPELCRPARTGGKSVADTQDMYISESGAVVMANGIDSTQLGAKVGSRRPDLLLFDDIEPDEGNYSPYQKERRLSTLINGVFAMNPNAVVQLCGTVTMFGSITHDLVRSAHGEDVAWVREETIRCRYYPAIVQRADGSEASLWEARWPLKYLKSIRHTRSYALNFDNKPRSIAEEGGLFEPTDIVVRDGLRVLERVLWVDPAVTTQSTSDPTGIAVVGSTGSKVVVEYAVGLRVKPDELKALVGRMLRENADFSTLLVEKNQGGHVWAELLTPVIPRGVALKLVHSNESKNARFTRHLDYHQQGLVVYAERFDELERQMLGYPKIDHDDVLDAVAGATEHFLKARIRPLRVGAR